MADGRPVVPASARSINRLAVSESDCIQDMLDRPSRFHPPRPDHGHWPMFEKRIEGLRAQCFMRRLRDHRLLQGLGRARPWLWQHGSPHLRAASAVAIGDAARASRRHRLAAVRVPDPGRSAAPPVRAENVDPRRQPHRRHTRQFQNFAGRTVGPLRIVIVTAGEGVADREQRKAGGGEQSQPGRKAQTHRPKLKQSPENVKERARRSGLERSALPSFVALLHLVDDVDATLAAHQLVGAMTLAQGLQRIADFHDLSLVIDPAAGPAKSGFRERLFRPDGVAPGRLS